MTRPRWVQAGEEGALVSADLRVRDGGCVERTERGGVGEGAGEYDVSVTEDGKAKHTGPTRGHDPRNPCAAIRAVS